LSEFYARLTITINENMLHHFEKNLGP
jgi:hypothetical protein